jgi:hypothetical protein
VRALSRTLGKCTPTVSCRTWVERRIGDVQEHCHWHPDPDSHPPETATAEAARGAATKSGGWPCPWTLSGGVKLNVRTGGGTRPRLTSLSNPTTYSGARRPMSAAFCAALETNLAGVTDGAGA